MTQRMSDKEYSIKQLRIQLEHLTNDLNKTTEHIQLLEIQEESKFIPQDYEPEQEISELLKRQNSISHEIITVKKKIQRLSAKTILKAELIILPVLIILLFFVATNYTLQPPEQSSIIKTRYLTENLQGGILDDYKHWNIISNTPLVVNIENNAQISDKKIQDIEYVITSTDTITEDSSLLYHSDAVSKSQFFKGWQGAIDTIFDTKYYVPGKFNVIQSSNGEGDIVITLSTINDADGYFGTTRTILDGNQILKAFITIYNADKLTDNQIESIVRHEFGHALGLPHTNNSGDLMHETIMTNHSYISECDINSLKKLYNDEKPSDDFCNSG
ncbi:MAG: matrixin family metalloprotease [Thaumarchaeota archaeon]|nr:matrixin family metalloprotease [Nitrososphaerota archaeon]